MTSTLPVAFVDHGSPMAALEESAYTRALATLGERLESAKAAVVVSAHWETEGGVRITASPHPETVHDFYGFPETLYRLEYPAPGDPDLAREIHTHLSDAGMEANLDEGRGLDHGAWVPLLHMWPGAERPVVQVSLPRFRNAEDLFAMGRALAPLRDAGVLLLGSGGIVHNIRLFMSGRAKEHMKELRAFDDEVMERLRASEAKALMGYRHFPGSPIAVPTTEHFDPLFFSLGAAGAESAVVDLHPSRAAEGLTLHVLELG